MAEMVRKCYGCKLAIDDEVVWLGEDYGDEGGGRVAYSFHSDCSLGAWPLYEMSEKEALEWIADGAHTNN